MIEVSILLPPITYALLVLLLVKKGNSEGIKNAFVKGHVIVFSFIAVFTEVLSAFHLIALPYLLGGWGLLCLGCIIAVVRLKRYRDIFSFPQTLPRISPLALVILTWITFILAATFFTAILYPPNNYDSMTYHMARTANWIANKSVAFYPTAIGRQNYQMPLAEFAIMHLQVLSGSDPFANLVQWLCFFASIVLAALIASELALDKTGQLVSSLIAATIPMAILQSSSTQNDLVLSCFTLCFALFMLRLGKALTLGNIVFAALSLGLTLLTKGTAYIYCGVLGISLAIPILFAGRTSHVRLMKRVGALGLVIVIAVGLNFGHYSRSYRLYGTPLSSGTDSYWNSDLSAFALLSNVPKNLALHLGTPSPRLNWYIYRAFSLVLGEQLNNPGTTWPGTEFTIPWNRHEDVAGNPIHMLTTLAAFAFVALSVRRAQNVDRNCYVGGVFVAGLLFFSCLKWQPWGSRLATPLFVLSAPVIAIALSNCGKRAIRYGALSMIALMVLFSPFFVLDNKSRSLLSLAWLKHNDRIGLYFTNRPDLYDSYRKAMNVVEEAGVQDVGLYLGGDDYEYPFWVFASECSRKSAVQFHHVGVDDQSKVLQQEPYLPAYVIATKTTESWAAKEEYSCIYRDKSIRVLKRRQPFVGREQYPTRPPL